MNQIKPSSAARLNAGILAASLGAVAMIAWGATALTTPERTLRDTSAPAPHWSDAPPSHPEPISPQLLASATLAVPQQPGFANNLK